jgi:hypothetical protein
MSRASRRWFYKRLDTGTFGIPEPAIEGDVVRLIDEHAHQRSRRGQRTTASVKDGVRGSATLGARSQKSTLDVCEE